MPEHMSVNKVYRIPWTESESGWGQRPDGATLHTTLADARTFIRKYWADMSPDVPDTYSRPDYDPSKDTVPMVEVHSETYMALVEAGGSMWEPVRVAR